MSNSPVRHNLSFPVWLLLTLSILLAGLAQRQTFRQIENINQSDTLKNAVYLSEQFKQIDTFLEAIRGQAEERLRSDPHSALTSQLYNHIQQRPDGELALDQVPSDLPPGLAGNLTGLGPIPPLGSEREVQIQLALSLSPLLAAASMRLSDKIGWAYFIGADNFIYLYPRDASSQFRFYRAIYEQVFWQDALAAHNAGKKAVLSRPYEDFVNLGTMVTMSQALYKDGNLVGILGIDILLSRLKQQLSELAPELGEYVLFNEHGQVLARSKSNALAEEGLTPTSGYEWHQGTLQLTVPIPETQLKLTHRIPSQALAIAMLSQSAPTMLAIFFMLLASLISLKSHYLNQRLNYLSYHDSLTGAFNRHFLAGTQPLGENIEHDRWGVILLDADHFKRINDRFGHVVGDRVLIQLAQLCQQQLRKSDRLVRWGGEEFLVLIDEGKDIVLSDVTERLRIAVASHDWHSIGTDLTVTISLGYHPYQGGVSLHEMIHRADTALYKAKSNGRNRSEKWQDHAHNDSA